MKMTQDLQPDIRLQASRRLDWRFLFPQVNLRRVAYIGAGDKQLIAALQLFSDDVKVMIDRIEGRNFDWLVMQDPNQNLFQRALPLLNDNGCLYIEFNRPAQFLSMKRLMFPNNYIRIARQADFQHVSSYWHWPTFEHTNRIISLESPESIQHVLAKGKNDPYTQIKLFGMSLLVKAKILPRLVGCLSLVAYRVVG